MCVPGGEWKMERKTNFHLKAVRYLPLVCLLLYIGLNLFLLMRHENWRDEAQAWQIAKNLGIKELFQQLRFEGHPCLWYLLLMPFAKLGVPFSCMGFISLALMAASVWIFLKKAPFAWPVKIILAFGSFFVYYYPVIARSYSMIPLVLFWLAMLYPERKKRGIEYGTALAVMTQIHVYMVGLSFLLSLCWLCETVWDCWRDKELIHKRVFLPSAAGLGLSFASGLFLIWELAGSLNLNPGIHINISSSFSYNLYRISVGSQWAVDNAFGIGLSDQAWKAVLVLVFVGLVILFWLSWKEALIFTGTVLIQVLMFTYIYLSSEQKAMILVHELIFLLWIIFEKYRITGKKGWKMQSIGWQICLVTLSLIAANGHAWKIRQDIEQPYSAGEDAAEYIRMELPEEELLIAAGDVGAFSIAAYLPEREIWYPLTEEPVTFAVWNEERLESIEYEEMLLRVKKRYPQASEICLICSGTNNISGLDQHLSEMEEIFHQDAMLQEESVTLYRVEF